MAEFKSPAVLLYVQGISEPLRRSLEQQGIRTAFKSDTTLRSHFVRPKDTVEPAKQDGGVYRIPCECGKDRETYAGEDQRKRQGCTTRPYTDLHRFWTRSRDQPL